MFLKRFPSLTVFLIMLCCLYSCGASDSNNYNNEIKTPVYSNKAGFIILNADSIKKIEMGNSQFWTDTSVTGQPRYLTSNQTISLCRLINDINQFDTAFSNSKFNLKNNKYLRYSFLITYKNKESDLLYIYPNLIANSSSRQNCYPLKKIANPDFWDKLWAEAIEPPCNCGVLIDSSIHIIDSIQKKNNIGIADATILKDSEDYFQLEFAPCCGGNPQLLFSSIWVKKNNLITTYTRFNPVKNYTISLRSYPFNTAPIASEVKGSPNLASKKMIVSKCYKGWLYVSLKYNNKTYSGWTRDYCSNPYTTCN